MYVVTRAHHRLIEGRMSNPIIVRACLAVALSAIGMSVGCGDHSSGPTRPEAPAALRVTSVVPSSGPAGVATAVRIVGTGFVSGATLTLDGVATNATFVSSVALTATAPAHPAGSIDIVVTNPGGQSSRLDAGFSYVAQLTSLLITGNTSLRSIGETSQLTATAGYADGSTRDVTREAQWTSSLPSIVTISADGILTARALGATSILVRYPTFNPSLFRSAFATVTPAGTFTASGRVREPGAGGVSGARVVHVPSGTSVLTDADGTYSLAALAGGPRFSFTKADYEEVELDVTPDKFSDTPMQRIIRMTAGGAPLSARLAPNDMDYLIGGSTRCQPCRLIRITSPTPGVAQVRLTWTFTSTALNLWVNGRVFLGDATTREVIADVPLGAAEVVMFVGRISPGGHRDYVPFTFSVTAPGSAAVGSR